MTLSCSFSSQLVKLWVSVSTSTNKTKMTRRLSLARKVTAALLSLSLLISPAFILTESRFKMLYQSKLSELTFVQGAPSIDKKKDVTVCLCLVVKDPFQRYIDEWVDYHIMALGFTSVRLYDNTNNFVMKNWGIHKPYANKITTIHFIPNITHNITEYKNGKTEVTKFQDRAYMDCVQSALDDRIDWIAAFDEDEFLVLHNSSSSIIEFMDKHCQYPCGQISFNIVPIGSVNRSRYVPVPVTRRFQYQSASNPDSEKWVKAIVNPKAVLQDQFWIHTFPLNNSWVWKDTTGRIIKSKKKRWNMQTNPHRPLDVAALYHFHGLSEEEYRFRIEVRKDINRLNQSTQYPNQMGFDVFDDTPWRVLRKSIPHYQQYDNVPDLG